MSKKIIPRIIHFTKKFVLLDWIVGAALLSVFFFFLFNRQSRKEEWIPVKLKVANGDWWWQGNAPENWYAYNINKGQFAYNSFGKKIAEIESIENYDLGGPSRLILVNLNLLTTYNKKTKTYTFNYQTLQVGKSLDLTFGTLNLNGLVIDIGKNPSTYSNSKLEIKLLSVYPWEAASYHPGLQMKDAGGNIIATIEDISVTDSEILELKDGNERLIAVPVLNGTYKDVALRLTIKTYKANGVAYFVDGSAVKVGNRIWLQFDNTAIKNAVITALY